MTSGSSKSASPTQNSTGGPDEANNGSSVIIIAGAAAGGVVLLGASSVAYWLMKRRRNLAKRKLSDVYHGFGNTTIMTAKHGDVSSMGHYTGLINAPETYATALNATTMQSFIGKTVFDFFGTMNPEGREGTITTIINPATHPTADVTFSVHQTSIAAPTVSTTPLTFNRLTQ